MKNSLSSTKKIFISKYLSENIKLKESRSTDVNILLNRVKLDKKKESRKKILFTLITSFSFLLFGVLIF
tara:strand:- start:498 stop:704 length:207 start_codon:yes stop_codon:yes gene_type:complete